MYPTSILHNHQIFLVFLHIVGMPVQDAASSYRPLLDNFLTANRYFSDVRVKLMDRITRHYIEHKRE